jgi:hypothetical protein
VKILFLASFEWVMFTCHEPLKGQKHLGWHIAQVTHEMSDIDSKP